MEAENELEQQENEGAETTVDPSDYFLARFEGSTLAIYFNDEKGDGVKGKMTIFPSFPDEVSDDETTASPNYRQRVEIDFGKLSATLTLTQDGVECRGQRERTKKGKIHFTAEWPKIRHS